MIEWLNQNQGFIMAILTFVYVIATIFLVYIAWKTSKISTEAKEISEDAKLISSRAVEISQKQLEKIAELEENRVRPYVLFNIFSDENSRTYSHIKNYGLTNYGLTAAFNVKVSIIPELKIHGTEELDTLSSNLIKMLPPDFELKSVVGATHEFHTVYPQSKFDGFIEYENSKTKTFKESFSLDLSFMKRRIRAEEKSVTDELQTISSKLEKISEEIKSIRTSD